MDFLSLHALSFEYGNRKVVDNVSFDSPRFRRLAIAGETGSGKTSLLKLIGGLLQPAAGSVYFENKRVPGAEEKLIPGHPNIAYLSQHFELHNNYRVYDLLDYANRLEGSLPQHVLSVCRVDHLLQRKTDQLSGGERQRVALARQLLRGPRLLLLDEPFSNLDGLHRDQLWEVLDDMEQQLGCSCLLVSHDPADSLAWAEDIIVLQEGRPVQRGG
ncbi:MAG: ATP-binding cassette domain-containing protein, partial [Flavihumibacter sp.]